MKRYDERILHLLLDRYESSLLYKEKNKVNISIFVPINKRTMPEYFDETSVSYDIIHEQLREMEAKGYLTLVWGKRKKHILEKCILNPEQADAVYDFLHRVPKKEKDRRLISLCKTLEQEYPAEACRSFSAWICERVLSGNTVKEYVNPDDLNAFRRLMKTLYAIETNTEELFLRQFSIRLFHDSKAAEQEIAKAVRILLQFRGDGNTETEPKSGEENVPFLSVDEVLAEYNIFRNPSWVMLKGTAVFSMRESSIVNSPVNLQAFSGGLGISNADVDKICWNTDEKPEYIITIENLTSFHQWDAGKGGLCIYLGGFVNEPRRKMLKDLRKAYPDVRFYHFGDMDCGGFRIWKNLCETTGIRFITMRMDKETYERYAEYGKELTVLDRKKLTGMLEDPFFSEQEELFLKMLETGRKIEQECVLSDI